MKNCKELLAENRAWAEEIFKKIDQRTEIFLPQPLSHPASSSAAIISAHGTMRPRGDGRSAP